MEETLRELASEHAVLHESLERAEAIERELGRYHRELEAERDQLRAEVERLKERVFSLGDDLSWAQAAPLLLTARAEAAESFLHDLATILNPHESYDSTKITGWARDTVERAAEADQAERTAAGLRRALEELVSQIQKVEESPYYQNVWFVAHLHTGAYIGPQYGNELEAAHAALSASPADHDRKLKAEALREAANKYEADHIESTNEPPREDYGGGYYDGQYAAVNWLMGEVARLEAANATK